MRTIIVCMLVAFVCSCSNTGQKLKWTSSTQGNAFMSQPEVSAVSLGEDDSVDVVIRTDDLRQAIDGFGGCFNELGWTSLSLLSEADRDMIFNDLFGKDEMNFTVCRMPVGSNDFSRDWYSYDEVKKDFEMKNFSIKNDYETLIPYIKSALKVNPDLYLWASPWCPPSWMKTNGKYACVYRSPEEFKAMISQLKEPVKFDRLNDLNKDEIGYEGVNMFINKPEYFKAYALYFRKFVEAYRNEGIQIRMVAPQNEFNSCQVYPSCIWTPDVLSEFIGGYLGPEMKEIGVDVMAGTIERPRTTMVDSMLMGKAMDYVSCLGFQWAGKPIIADMAKKYPSMKLMQTESECGDGSNTWDYCLYTWTQMRNCFRDGVSSYMYWNISLEKSGLSRWLWRQNSLISVDAKAKKYTYNPEYYLMKHFSHFITPGAHLIGSEGDYEDVLAFLNPDGEIIILVANQGTAEQEVNLDIDGHTYKVSLSPKSINTFTL